MKITVTPDSTPRFKIKRKITRVGPTLWRRSHVYATRDFTSGSGEVRRGAKGGIVKIERNLDSSGCSWIADGAVVEAEGARVRISGNALVRGRAKLNGSAEVYGNATIEGNAKVHGSAVVCHNAKLGGDIEVSSGVFNGTKEYRRLAVYIYYDSYDRISSIFQGCKESDDESKWRAKGVLGVLGDRYNEHPFHADLQACIGILTMRHAVEKFKPSPWTIGFDWAFAFGTFGLFRLARFAPYIDTAVSGMKDMLDLYKADDTLKDVREKMEEDRSASQGAKKYELDQFFKVEQHSFDVLERCIKLDKTRAECLKLQSVSCSKLNILREECLKLQSANRR